MWRNSTNVSASSNFAHNKYSDAQIKKLVENKKMEKLCEILEDVCYNGNYDIFLRVVKYVDLTKLDVSTCVRYALYQNNVNIAKWFYDIFDETKDIYSMSVFISDYKKAYYYACINGNYNMFVWLNKMEHVNIVNKKKAFVLCLRNVSDSLKIAQFIFDEDKDSMFWYIHDQDLLRKYNKVQKVNTFLANLTP